MELILSIESVKYDYEAKQEGDQVIPGDPLYIITLGQLVLTRNDYLALLTKAKDHTIKVNTE